MVFKNQYQLFLGQLCITLSAQALKLEDMWESLIVLCAMTLSPGSTQDLTTNYLQVLSGCDIVSKEFSQLS